MSNYKYCVYLPSARWTPTSRVHTSPLYVSAHSEVNTYKHLTYIPLLSRNLQRLCISYVNNYNCCVYLHKCLYSRSYLRISPHSYLYTISICFSPQFICTCNLFICTSIYLFAHARHCAYLRNPICTCTGIVRISPLISKQFQALCVSPPSVQKKQKT